MSAGGFQPRIGALSGPSFAKEVARGDPTAINDRVSGCAISPNGATGLQRPPLPRLYRNEDVAGWSWAAR